MQRKPAEHPPVRASGNIHTTAQPAVMSARLLAVCRVAVAASRAIMAVYAQSGLMIVQKDDNSPVTQADHAADAVLQAQLPQVWPALPVLSEESTASAALSWSHYWLVDPLDGTREFIKRNGEFTVNIAEIVQGQVGLSVLALPAQSRLYARDGNRVWKVAFDLGAEPASALGAPVRLHPHPPSVQQQGAWRVALSRRAAAHGGLYPRLLAHLDAQNPAPIWTQAGSAYKFALMAEGQIDLYPRLHPTSEWDTAAGQGILEGLGGLLVDDQGRPFAYNQRDHWLNGRFLALRCREDWTAWQGFWMSLNAPANEAHNKL